MKQRRRRLRNREIDQPTMALGRAGHDGEPPVFTSARDDLTDPEDKSRKLESPQNVNCDRARFLFHREEIDARQYEAARRLQKDWETALIMPVASNVMVGAGGSGDVHPNDAKIAAMQRHGAAKAALGWGWNVVELVVLEHLSLNKAGARMRCHEKRAMGMLWLALHMLADFYRLPRELPARALSETRLAKSLAMSG